MPRLGRADFGSLRLLSCCTIPIVCAFIFFRGMDRELNHDAFLENDPPEAILSGVEEPPLEKRLIAHAEAHLYRPESLVKRRVLWLPPAVAR